MSSYTEYELQAFSQSAPLTLGVELELQIVSGQDYNLVGAAPDLLRELGEHDRANAIVAELQNQLPTIENTEARGNWREFLAAQLVLNAERNTASEPLTLVPSMIAVPQSGPITSRFFATAARFSSSSSVSGTLSLKRKTCRPSLRAFHASAVAYSPGVEISTRPGPASSARASARV